MVARSVPVLMVSFVFCWFPNHAVTLWGILVVFYLVPWDSTFYIIHTFFFPVITRLAHSNSCLNPVLYVFSGASLSKFWSVPSGTPGQGLCGSGRWVAGTRAWTLDKPKHKGTPGCHLDVPVPFSEIYQGQNPQILGRSCALCQSVGSPGKV